MALSVWRPGEGERGQEPGGRSQGAVSRAGAACGGAYAALLVRTSKLL